jgi:hypothetical protein
MRIHSHFPLIRLLSVALLNVAWSAACTEPRPIGATSPLLDEMIDLESMAEFPDPPYTCKQFSSYDRASTSPADTKTWFANDDAGQFVRSEQHAGRTEFVMMDAAGPGAVVRIWSANPTGTIRIYLDGNDTPVIAAPMADLLGGNLPGIPSPIACERSRGWTSYFPIPYARHCKITSDQRGFYYHVNYRTYPPGTQVTTFSPSELETSAPWLYLLAARLAYPQHAAPRPRLKETSSSLSLTPGAVALLADLKGPGAIRELVMKLDAPDLDEACRQTVLAIAFDGEWTVLAPLGDFFGAGPGINPYDSLPMGMSADGAMWSHWVMPYALTARVELRNMGNQPIKLSGRLGSGPYRWTERSMHFCAKWRTEFNLPTRPMQDWNYLDVAGQGVFAGVAFAIANPVKHWWGEGDEKIYVDGETFPSHFGTGTEDYYGYAWCSPIPFQHAYHNQPRCDGPGNYGHTAVNRWHILDRIPFEKSFRFDMEIWHWNETCKVTPSVVAYWYARPGARDRFPMVQQSDVVLNILPPYTPAMVAGAIEGEKMRVIESVGAVDAQDIDGCSNDAQLWWHGGQKPGDKLVLGFEAPRSGRHHVYLRGARAKDYGIIQLAINGQTAPQPLDCYSPELTVADEVEVGVFDLKAGENQLSAEVIGSNDRAIKQYMFGLDYVRLQPVP